MLDYLVGAMVEIASTPATPREIGYEASRSAGLSREEWKCLDQIIWRESRWDPGAENGSHYGLGQIRNSKSWSIGKTRKQVIKTIEYINSRYDSTCNALRFHKSHGWY